MKYVYFGIVIFLLFLFTAVGVIKSESCRKSGGVLVRGFYEFVCIQQQEARDN